MSRASQAIFDLFKQQVAIQFISDLGARHFVRLAPQYTPNPNPIGFRNNNLALDHNGAWNIGRCSSDVKRVGAAPAPFNR